MTSSRLRAANVVCPCCGYVTLTERAAYEICPLCWWEDDGQDDPRADEVWGGPNGDVSLSEARRNFRDHLTMYRRGEDSRISGEDSAVETEAKRVIIESFDQLRSPGAATDPAALWSRIEASEAVLEAELQRAIREFERQGGGDGSV